MIKIFVERKAVQAILLAATIAFYFILTFQKIDILPSEDDVHLFTGLSLNLPLQKFGNLAYYLSFYAISKFVDNPLTIVFLNYFLLSTFAFISLFLALNKHLQSFLVAFLLSLCFLFSEYQILLVPKLTYLNFILLSLAIYLIDIKRSDFRNYLIVTVCILLNVYVSRPEFIWFLIPCLALMFISYFRNSPKPKQTGLLIGLFVLILFLYWLGGGFYPSGYFKEIFIQHFFDNYEVWTGKHYDLADEFKQFEVIYGEVASDLQVFTANPSFLLKHAVFNLKNSIIAVIGVLKSSFYDIFVGFFGAKTKYFVVILVLISAVLVDLKATVFRFRESIKPALRLLKFHIWLVLPALLVVLIIYPRAHFIFMLLPFIFLLLGIFVKSMEMRKMPAGNFFAPVLMLLLMVGIGLKWPLGTSRPNNVDFYNYLNNRELSKSLKMLSNDNFGFLYFSKNFVRIGWNPFSEQILDKIKTEKIDVVSIYRLDLEVPATRAFVDSLHTKSGFVQIRQFESQKRYLWVRPELMSKFQ
jgi:hypothetical protein